MLVRTVRTARTRSAPASPQGLQVNDWGSRPPPRGSPAVRWRSAQEGVALACFTRGDVLRTDGPVAVPSRAGCHVVGKSPAPGLGTGPAALRLIEVLQLRAFNDGRRLLRSQEKSTRAAIRSVLGVDALLAGREPPPSRHLRLQGRSATKAR